MPLHPSVDAMGRLMVALIHEMTFGEMDENRRENCRTLRRALDNTVRFAEDCWNNGDLTEADKEVLMMLDHTLGSVMNCLRQVVTEQTGGQNYGV